MVMETVMETEMDLETVTDLEMEMETEMELEMETVTVTVLEMEQRLLSRVVAEPVSDFYQRLHTDAGVDVRTGVRVVGFEGEQRVERVLLQGGDALEADVVVIGVGVVPNVELAAEAGLATDDGIEMRTKRAMPEIGNEDAISSCGGSEWGEDVAYVEDDPVRILRGADEDKTLLPEGAFSAGARTLPLDDGDLRRELGDHRTELTMQVVEALWQRRAHGWPQHAVMHPGNTTAIALDQADARRVRTGIHPQDPHVSPRWRRTAACRLRSTPRSSRALPRKCRSL